MSNHTAEPWEARNSTILAHTPSGAGIQVLSDEDAKPEDLARAAECVSALKDVKDPAATLAEVRKVLMDVKSRLHWEGMDCSARQVMALLDKLGKG
jgi:hypothetical protein